MNNEYFCFYCGEFHAAKSFLTGGVCSKSPNWRHKIYTGSMRGRQGSDEKGRFHGRNHHYHCKYCGQLHVTISMLTAKPCKKSPTGYHQPYEGKDKPIYVCKYCAGFSRLIKKLTQGSCSASPNRYHQPEK